MLDPVIRLTNEATINLALRLDHVRKPQPCEQPLSAAEEGEKRILSTLPTVGYAVSVVIPLYNEEEIVGNLVTQFIEKFGSFPFKTEFLLCENGSQDKTREIAERLASEHFNVRLEAIKEASYGLALMRGIRRANADVVVIFNADLWCKRFFVDSVLLLETGYDLVVGSKRLNPRLDKRPWMRRFITAAFNVFLKHVFGFNGTDTHGMKALRRSTILPIVEKCLTAKEVFDTELILKAQCANLNIKEIAIEVCDVRPARLSLLRRVPSTLRDLWTIHRSLERAKS